jgi:hypothetical protein
MRMMKKRRALAPARAAGVCLLCVLAGAALAAIAAAPGVPAVHAGANAISVQINGQATPFTDAAPCYENDVLYIPLRPVAEQLNAPIRWDGEHRRAILQYRNLEIQFYVEKAEITVISPAESRFVDVGGKPILKDGRIYISLETLRSFMEMNDANLAAGTLYLFDTFPRRVFVNGKTCYIADGKATPPAREGAADAYTKNGMEIVLSGSGCYVIDVTGEARRYEAGAAIQ